MSITDSNALQVQERPSQRESSSSTVAAEHDSLAGQTMHAPSMLPNPAEGSHEALECSTRTPNSQGKRTRVDSSSCKSADDGDLSTNTSVPQKRRKSEATITIPLLDDSSGAARVDEHLFTDSPTQDAENDNGVDDNTIIETGELNDPATLDVSPTSTSTTD